MSFRSFLYALAKGMGDASAIQNKTVGKRIARRLVGRFTGQLLGKLFR